MKNIVQMFLPFFLFLLLTVILFFYLKNDDSPPKYSSPKEVREIFDDVKEIKVNREVQVKQFRSRGDAEVTRVRWNHHKGFERLVFDVTDDTSATFTMGVDSMDSTKVHGELVGYSDFLATLPNFSSSNIIKEMKVYELNDNTYKFTIFLYRSMDYKAFSLKNPARIVIDMY